MRARIDIVGDVLDLAVQPLTLERELDLPLLAQLDEVEIALEDVAPDPQVVERLDDEQGVVVV